MGTITIAVVLFVAVASMAFVLSLNNG